MSKLNKEQTIKLFTTICESRAFQETLTNNGFPGYLDYGEEAITAGTLAAINDDDYVNNYFRGDGVALRYRGIVSLDDEMAWWFGKQTDGRPLTSLVPTNWSQPDKAVIGATSSCLGGDADLMLGVALAQKLKKTGKIVAFITGDGTLAKGNYHEVFTMASLFKLPILFIIRANGWAMSTSIEKSVAFKKVSDMAAGYQIPSAIIDGNDAFAVYNKVSEAAEYVRSGNGPYFIEATTYRMAPHSSHDEDDYRPAEDKIHWAAKDPILLMQRIMTGLGYDGAELENIKSAAKAAAESAYEKCAELPSADVNEVLDKEIATVNLLWGRK